METDLELASNWPEIDEVQQALQAQGYWRGKPTGRASPGAARARRCASSRKDGFVIWVGRNSRQNEIVTFDKGSPQDLWLHAHGVAGAHVIVKFDGRQIPEAVIEAAAALAAYYSARRGESSVDRGRDAAPLRAQDQGRGGGHGHVPQRGNAHRRAARRSGY